MKIKVLSAVVYCIMEKYICVHYLGCLQNKLHVHFSNKGFEKQHTMMFQELALLNYLWKIISCHGFVNDKKSDVVLLCCIKVVSYYLWNVFVIHDTNSSALKNVPQRVNKIINAKQTYIYIYYLVFLCYSAIPSADNTLKKHHHFLVCSQNLHQRTEMIKDMLYICFWRIYQAFY